MAEPTALRFDSPPVRSVRLAYFFTSEQPLLTVHAAAVYQMWREQYPIVKELAPRAPVDGEPQEFLLLSDPHHWPMPFVEFEGPQSQTRLFFQADRFGLSWTFGESDETDESTPYPGYDKLSGELDEKFSQFCRAALDGGAGDLIVTGAECAYKNDLADQDFPKYVTGLLTQWSKTVPTLTIDSSDSASFSRHLHHEGDAAKPIWITAESEEGGTTVWITSRVQDAVDASGADALQAAHDILIDAFLASTSEEMREAWGPL